jgi:hypothetical protein
MMQKSAFFTAVAVLIGTGVVHGLWTDRWTVSTKPEACAAKLSCLPMSIGDWNGRSLEVDPLELDKGGIVNYIARDYVNSRTKNQVQMILTCGRPGSICAHTPDVCFEGAGYRMSNSPDKFSPTSSPSDSFWLVNFVKDGTEGRGSIRVFWSWNAVGHWQAADYPRLAFARHPALFKLYVSRRLSGRKENNDRDPCLDFLNILLPELKKCLFPETENP